MSELFMFSAGLAKKKIVKLSKENFSMSSSATLTYSDLGLNSAAELGNLIMGSDMVLASMTPPSPGSSEYYGGTLIVETKVNASGGTVTVYYPSELSHMHSGDLNIYFFMK